MIKRIKMLTLLLCLSLGSALVTGCTTNTPPLDPPHLSSTDTSNVLSETSAPSKTSPTTFSLWNNNMGEPSAVVYQRDIEGVSGSFQTEDKQLLTKLVKALKGIDLKQESDEKVVDDRHILTFTWENDSEYTIDFEGGDLILNEKRYEIIGYQAVEDVLLEIVSKNSSESSGTGNITDDQWLKNMQKTDERLQQLLNTEEYKSSDKEKRRELALQLLNELEEEGLIEKNSIFSSDDMISYSYDGGGQGGIQLKEFDPLFNGSSAQSNDPSSTSIHSAIPDNELRPIENKNYQDFLGSVISSSSPAKANESLFEKYVASKLSDDKTHYRISEYLNTGTSNRYKSKEIQKDGSNRYYRFFSFSDRDDYTDIAQAINAFFSNGELLIRNGKQYYLAVDYKAYFEISDKDLTFFNYDLGNDILKMTDRLKESGTCTYEGKKTNYEVYTSDTAQLTLYFDGDQFFKGEIYLLDTSDIPSTEQPSDKKYSKNYVLRGYLYIDTDLPSDKSLFEIPSDYKQYAAEELTELITKKYVDLTQQSDPGMLLPE